MHISSNMDTEFKPDEISNSNYALSNISLRMRHTSSRQPYKRKFPCVQRDLRYGDCLFHLYTETKL